MKMDKMGLSFPNHQTSLQYEEQKSVPLSFAQERLWILDRLEPDSSSYNTPAAFLLSGVCSIPALTESINEMVRRHEVLRASFVEIDGETVQQISSPLDIELNLVELAEKDTDADMRRQAVEDARRPFDLTHGPLIRATLFRMDAEKHLLVVVLHHIVTDGWSMGVFFRELAILYNAFSKGNPSPLSDLPIQYADFAIWQRQHLVGDVLQRQLDYWRIQLADLATLELPTNRPRPPIQSYRGSRQSFQLAPVLIEALHSLTHF